MNETVIDALVVALNLDPTQFNKELAAYQKTRKSAGDQDERLDKAELERSKKRADAVGEIKKQTLGLFATIVGAAGVEKFITTQTTNLSAMGRAAASMGASVRDVSAFSSMIQRNGGDAATATKTLQGLTQAMAEFQLTGRTAILPELSRIGAADPKLSAIEVYKRFAKAIEDQHMSAPVATLLGTKIGLDEASVNEALKGSAQVNRDLAESYKIGVPNADQVAKVQALQNAFMGFRHSVTNAGNGLLFDFAPGATAALNGITAITTAAPGATQAVIALGLALAGLKAAGSFLAIGRALGLLPAATAAAEGGGMLGAVGGAAMSAASIGGPLGAFAWGILHPTAANVGEDAQVAALHAQEAKRRAAKAARAPAVGPAASGEPTTVEGRAAAIEAEFRRLGWGDAAHGMVAAMRAENGQLDIRAKPIDPKTGKPMSSAEGLGQWLAARQKNYQKLFPGQDFHKSTWRQQVAFIDWELRNTERGAGAAMQGASPEAAAYAYVTKFMRPGKGTAGDLQRASRVLHSTPDQMRAAASVTMHIDNLTITTQATDPPAIARDIAAELKRQTLVAQSDAGMR